MSLATNICTFCLTNLVRAKASWAYHHPSHKSLAESRRNGCAFCVLLYKDVQANWNKLAGFEGVDDTMQRWLSEDVQKCEELELGCGSKTSLYRWSIRSLGKTRDSKAMVAVTFRVVPKQPKEGEGRPKVDSETFGLLERVFYCFPESDLGELLGKGAIGGTTDPDKNDGIQLKSWLQNCDREHKHCPGRTRQRGAFVPTRLLVVGDKGSKENLKVVETGPNNIRGPYVTLSHCWGLPDPKSPKRDALNSATKEKFMTEGVPWKDLSLNFQQAIEVARFMEMEYIWIDSLCIIQKDAEDWKTEGSRMHKVYRNSYCNIAAADSKDSNGGLFRPRKAYHVLPARFEADGQSTMFGRKTWRVVREDLWEYSLLKTPLYTRGWVFQERMLSPKAVHFGKHQIFWDCAEISACETLPRGLPLPIDQKAAADRHWRGRLQESGSNRWVSVSGANDDSIEEFWRLAVRNYTTCDLTNQTDKRIAVWGIAKLIRDSLGEAYGAGLWERALEEQLAWRVADSSTAERPEALSINPSWTWTSVKGTIVLGSQTTEPRAYTVKDHASKPISFRTEGEDRPILHRERSDNIKTEIVAMGKDLETVAEKRKNSATSKRLHSVKEEADHVDRDVEPKLAEEAIAIEGYLGTATLRLSTDTGKWSLDLAKETGFTPEEVIVEAFPDTLPETHETLTHFMVLSLTKHGEPDPSLPSLIESIGGLWYSGAGIMLQPLDKNKAHWRRTGALSFRKLSTQAWEYLQITGQQSQDTRHNGRKKAGSGIRFLLV